MHPVLLSIGNFNFYTLTLFLILAVIFGLFVFWRNAKLDDWEEEKIFDLFLAAFASGMLGGRLFHFLIDPRQLVQNPVSFFYPQELGGFSFWGAIIFSWLALLGVSKLLRFPFLKTIDHAALGVALGGVLVSIGLFFDGRGFGQETNSFLGVAVPTLLGNRHPVSIYYALGFLVIFFLILRAQRRVHHPGFLALLFLSLYSILAIIVEIKSETLVYWWKLGQSQFLALVFLFLSGLVWYRLAKRDFFQDLDWSVSQMAKLIENLFWQNTKGEAKKFFWPKLKSFILWFKGPWW